MERRLGEWQIRIGDAERTLRETEALLSDPPRPFRHNSRHCTKPDNKTAHGKTYAKTRERVERNIRDLERQIDSAIENIKVEINTRTHQLQQTDVLIADMDMRRETRQSLPRTSRRNPIPRRPKRWDSQQGQHPQNPDRKQRRTPQHPAPNPRRHCPTTAKFAKCPGRFMSPVRQRTRPAPPRRSIGHNSQTSYKNNRHRSPNWNRIFKKPKQNANSTDIAINKLKTQLAQRERHRPTPRRIRKRTQRSRKCHTNPRDIIG